MNALRIVLLTIALLAPTASVLAQTEEIQDALRGRKTAAPPARTPAAAPRVDYRDYVFLASDRPVLLRLHVQMNGKPYFAAWNAFMRKWFAHFDRDGNGVLSKAELERAPNAPFLSNHLAGSLGQLPPGQKLRLAQVDTNKDGKVTWEEFAAHYRRTGFAALRFFSNFNQASASRSTDALFKYLDANKDGKLSPQELSKAPAALQKLDRDEDEMLTEAELTPTTATVSYPAPPLVMTTLNQAPTSLVLEVIDAAPAATAIIAHYDKDKNKKLSRKEVGLDKTTFAKLDANHDGQLDAKELEGFLRRDADLEMTVRLGKLQAQESVAGLLIRTVGGSLGMKNLELPRVEVFNPKKRTMPLTNLLHAVDNEAAWLSLGDAHLELFASASGNGLRLGNRNFLVQQFETLFDKKGYVERKQLQGMQYLEAFFLLADRNGDDKMTRAEMAAYQKLIGQGSSSFSLLTATDHGRNLFELLDTDGDGRLSVRELRNVWATLRPLAKDPAGFARSDIPRRVQLVLAPGQFFGGGRRVAGARTLTRQKKPAPLWFQKMDRNNDGDLSPAEFLGAIEDFRRLDTDGDGLISGAEASKAGAKPAGKR
jgi:Ca2+-binding EF-hand superfamily protein